MPKNIVILGAGISGLTAAWKIKNSIHSKDVKVTIIEKSSRPGGWIHTINKDGFLFELGPRSCRSGGSGAATLNLIEQLGLQDRVIKGDPVSHVRYLYTDQKLRKVPQGLWFLGPQLLSGLWNDLRTSPGSRDESIYDFILRRFNRTIAEKLIDPLVSGIYAGDIRHLSMRSCFPKLFDWEQQYGSVMKGLLFQPKGQFPKSAFICDVQKSSIFSLKGGMEELICALVRQLDVDIKLNTTADKIEYRDGGAEILLSSGETLFADQVISTLPSEEIDYASVAVINLGYRKKVLPKQGYGYLIPSMEKERILGCVWDSCVFPQQNQKNETRLTVMMGGVHHPEVKSMSESEAVKIALEAIQRHLGIVDYPDVISYTLALKAIPQYPVGHQQWVGSYRDSLPTALTYMGTAFGGVAVNDCIDRAMNMDSLD